MKTLNHMMALVSNFYIGNMTNEMENSTGLNKVFNMIKKESAPEDKKSAHLTFSLTFIPTKGF